MDIFKVQTHPKVSIATYSPPYRTSTTSIGGNPSYPTGDRLRASRGSCVGGSLERLAPLLDPSSSAELKMLWGNAGKDIDATEALRLSGARDGPSFSDVAMAAFRRRSKPAESCELTRPVLRCSWEGCPVAQAARGERIGRFTLCAYCEGRRSGRQRVGYLDALDRTAKYLSSREAKDGRRDNPALRNASACSSTSASSSALRMSAALIDSCTNSTLQLRHVSRLQSRFFILVIATLQT